MAILRNSDTGFRSMRIGIFLFLMIFTLSAKPKPSSYITYNTKFNDSVTLSIKVSPELSGSIKKLFKKPVSKDVLNNYLDSLGFFNVEIEQLKDTIFYAIGPRAEIDTILLVFDPKIALPISNLLEELSFPAPYNAAIIDQVSKKVISICTENGYPFSNVSLSFQEKENLITPVLNLKSEKRYCFEPPLLNNDFLLNPNTLKNDLIIKSGSIFNLSDIDETIARLKQRPYINSAIAKEPVIIPESYDAPRSDTSFNCENSVTIPLEIKENSGMGIDGIIGFSSAEKGSGWNGQVNLILQNVLHRGEALTLNYRGEEDFQQFSLTLDKAYPFGLPFLFSGFFDLEVLNEKYGSLKGGLDVLTSLKGNLQIGIGVTGHEPTLEDGSSWYSVGFDLLLRVLKSTYGAGIKAGSLDLRTGSGYRDQSGVKLGRFSFNLSTAGQFPFLSRNAFYGRIFTGLITTGEESLHETEMIRVGGHQSLRGYAIDQYSFTACAFLQFEYRFYFLNKGSLFLFADGGVGSQNEVTIENSTSLFGYGLGIRVPIRLGRLSLEYARNYNEGRSPGRIHIRIQNSLSKGM